MRWWSSCRKLHGAGASPARSPTYCHGDTLIERWHCWYAAAPAIRSTCAHRNTVGQPCICLRASLNRETAGRDPRASSFCRKPTLPGCLRCCGIRSQPADRNRQLATEQIGRKLPSDDHSAPRRLLRLDFGPDPVEQPTLLCVHVLQLLEPFGGLRVGEYGLDRLDFRLDELHRLGIRIA